MNQKDTKHYYRTVNVSCMVCGGGYRYRERVYKIEDGGMTWEQEYCGCEL